MLDFLTVVLGINAATQYIQSIFVQVAITVVGIYRQDAGFQGMEGNAVFLRLSRFPNSHAVSAKAA